MRISGQRETTLEKLYAEAHELETLPGITSIRWMTEEA